MNNKLLTNKFTTSRRSFLDGVTRATSAAALSSLIPFKIDGLLNDNKLNILTPDLGIGQYLNPEGVRALAMRAIDAAKSGGATYADIRLTRKVAERFVSILSGSRGQSASMGRMDNGDHDFPYPDSEHCGAGVRVLVNGSWGFAASPIWTLDEMTILATEAIGQAIANARVNTKHVELAPTVVVTGNWSPPGIVDPFLLPPEEKLEHLRSLVGYCNSIKPPEEKYGQRQLTASAEFSFTRQEWALATSDGTYCTQQRFTADGGISMTETMTTEERYDAGKGATWAFMKTSYPGLVGQGWELCNGPDARQYMERAYEEYSKRSKESDSVTPIEVGRYTVVCGASLSARLIDATLGGPTELDRSLGYEANAGGTSFLNDPLEMLGSLQLGSDLLTVSGNRSTPRHLATVKWDDEGVEPKPITLIDRGILSDFQTNRESATWLADSAKWSGTTASNGCASSDSGLSIPMIHPPNLAMHPGEKSAQFEDLVKEVEKGIAFIDGDVSMDFQGRSGLVIGRGRRVREIVNGKLGDYIISAGILLESKSWWKNLVAVGGVESVETVAATSQKGQPSQETNYTVSAVPFVTKDATVINYLQKQA